MNRFPGKWSRPWLAKPMKAKQLILRLSLLSRAISVDRGSLGPRLCENVPGRTSLRIVFFATASRQMLGALLRSVASKLRCKFYLPEQRQSFHTAWAISRRAAHAVASAAHLMRPLRAQRDRMRAWPRRDCELDRAGIDALGGPTRISATQRTAVRCPSWKG